METISRTGGKWKQYHEPSSSEMKEHLRGALTTNYWNLGKQYNTETIIKNHLTSQKIFNRQSKGQKNGR